MAETNPSTDELEMDERMSDETQSQAEAEPIQEASRNEANMDVNGRTGEQPALQPEIVNSDNGNEDTEKSQEDIQDDQNSPTDNPRVSNDIGSDYEELESPTDNVNMKDCLPAQNSQDIRYYCKQFLQDCQVEGRPRLGNAGKLSDNALKKLVKSRGIKSGATLLLWASRLGLTDFLEKLHRRLDRDTWRELLSVKDRYGNTTLHWACRFNHAAVVNVIGGSVNNIAFGDLALVKNKYGVTALHWACRYSDTDVVRTLIDMLGVNIFVRLVMLKEDEYQSTALHWACRYGKTEIVRVILEKSSGVSVGVLRKLLMHKNKQTTNHVGTDKSHTDITKDHGAAASDISNEKLILPKTNGDSTAFDWACTHGHSNVIDVFASILTPDLFQELAFLKDDVFGNTAFHWACGRDQASVVAVIMRYLRETKGTDAVQHLFRSKSNDGNTALHWACGEGHVGTLEAVVAGLGCGDFGQLCTIQNNKGETPLFWACTTGQIGTVHFLLANLDETSCIGLLMKNDNLGNTPLHSACRNGHDSVVRILFDKLDDSSICRLAATKDDTKHWTALHWACDRGHCEVVKVFTDKLNPNFLHKVVNMRDQADLCALDLAVDGKHFSILSLLLSLKPTLFENNLQIMKKTVVIEACLRGATGDVLSILDAAYINDRTGNSTRLLFEFLSAVDDDGRNVLHMACIEKQVDLVRALLSRVRKLDNNKFAFNVYEHIICHRDNMNRSVLLDCSQHLENQVVQLILDVARRSGCVKALLEISFLDAFEEKNNVLVNCILKEANLSGCDRDVLFCTSSGRQTVIHRACQNRYDSIRCLKTVLSLARKHGYLIELLRQKDQFGRTFLSYTSDICESILQLLIKTVADCESINPETNLCHWFLTETDSEGNTAIQCAQQRVSILSQFLAPFLKNTSGNNKPEDFYLLHTQTPFSGEHNLLKVIGDHQLLDLIQHKYTQDYLKACWESYIRHFFFTNLVLNLTLLLSLTSFVVSHRGEITAGNSTQVSMTSTVPALTAVFQYVLIICTLLILALEILQMIAKEKHYWRTSGNYVDLLVCLSSLLVATVARFSGYQPWIHQVGVMAMWGAWINAAWTLSTVSFGRFKNISLMLIMLFRVVRSVCIFLPVFMIFVLAFALSYSSLVYTQDAFRHLGFSIAKTMTMTVGELDFGDIFFPDDDVERPHFYTLTFLVFVTFLGIMNISVMNLLVGKAVGDIGDLNNQSEVIAFNSMVDLAMECQATTILLKDIKMRLTQGRSERRTNSYKSVPKNEPVV